MPETAERIDALRLVYGEQAVDSRIRRAMAGEATFYARERGEEVGNAPGDLSVLVENLEAAFGEDFSVIAFETGNDLPTLANPSEAPWAATGLEARRFCHGCDGSCVGTAALCSTRRHVRNSAGGFPPTPASNLQDTVQEDLLAM